MPPSFLLSPFIPPPPHSHIHSSSTSTSTSTSTMSPPWRWCCFFLAHAPLLLAHSQCTTQCGGLLIPFPFFLNSSSCPSLSLSDAAFSLSCINSSSLFLTIASHTYRLLHFFPDGVLLDFPNTTLCRPYNDLRSFPFSANQYFAISTDNVLDLYDCEDSSLCKPDCEKTSLMPGCDGRAAGYPSCCYPLSDRGSWHPADTLAAFSQFGCRGFSSWVVSPGSRIGMRGIKLEWAVPRNSTHATCAANANAVNATSVAAAIRCRCLDGFSGDGFSVGAGCLKSCFKDGKEVHGNDCYQKKHGRKKEIILAGVLTSSLCVVSLTALFLVKRSIRSDKFISEQSNFSSHKPCRSRLFTYHDLHEATKGFVEDQRLTLDSSSSTSTLYAGVLTSGSPVAIQKLQCQTETELVQVLFKLETLSAISHRNMACIIGWCIDTASTPLVVYDYPENGTFREHLRRARDENAASLEWRKRLNIAAETACILAFLHHEISPPIYHHDLQSGCMFLDADFSVKLAGFELHNNGGGGGEHDRRRNDVYSLGLVLVEMITGNAAATCCSATLQKIKKGKVEEMVDPSLYYHEQTPVRREQIEVSADLAMRCLLFGGDGKVGMVDVARELVHLVKESVDGSSRLEETFSNSSLLQMISMSPDSIHVP